MSDLFLTPTDPTRADSPAPESAMKSVPACIGGFPIVVPDDAYMRPVAALFVRADSIYKTLPGVDCWDIERDARTWPGGMPVVAHPPCRAWGRLRAFAKPRADEMDLARWAVAQVRQWGGVLEHPECSTLWPDQGLPEPEQRDALGGWTLPIHQWWFGHRAQKRTLLYIVGCGPNNAPRLPLRIGISDCRIRLDKRRPDGTHIRKGDADYRPILGNAEREHTPPLLAEWLVELARRTSVLEVAA